MATWTKYYTYIQNTMRPEYVCIQKMKQKKGEKKNNNQSEVVRKHIDYFIISFM